jgi:endoglucanase
MCASCPTGGHAQEFKGVNLAGAGFASSKVPGVYGKDFLYPKPEEVTYFTRKGMNVFRISVLWARLQPKLFGPLDDKELARLAGLVETIRQHGASTIIDIHNYGRYRSVPIGTGEVTASAFTDLWIRLAGRFGHDDTVLFGLMNEPQIPDPLRWRDIQQQAIDGIRHTGSNNRILVSGVGWDGAHNFPSLNGDALAGLKDPRHRIVFEVHQYFDHDSSGTKDTCVGPDEAVRRLIPVTQWLRTHHQQGFLGEFGVSRRPECATVLDHVVAFMKANSREWLGWTYWAAGPLWGNYMFTLEPDHGTDRFQMTTLLPYLNPVKTR